MPAKTTKTAKQVKATKPAKDEKITQAAKAAKPAKAVKTTQAVKPVKPAKDVKATKAVKTSQAKKAPKTAQAIEAARESNRLRQQRFLEKHRGEINDKRRERYSERKESGCCPRCGQKLRSQKFTLCKTCLEKAKGYNQR